MEIKPIKTNKQYETYMTWVDAQFEKGVKKNTTLGDQLEIVLMLIQKYEDEKFPIFVMELVNFWKREIPKIFNILIILKIQSHIVIYLMMILYFHIEIMMQE